jgi:hypothetical protein
MLRTVHDIAAMARQRKIRQADERTAGKLWADQDVAADGDALASYRCLYGVQFLAETEAGERNYVVGGRLALGLDPGTARF